MSVEDGLGAPLGRSRSQRRALLVALVLLGGIGFLPLFGGPTYEFALASGLVLPLLVSSATALSADRERLAPLAAWSRGVSSGLLFALAGLALALLHGLRAGFCGARFGLLLYGLGPAVGCVMAGVWGASVSVLARPKLPSRFRALALLALAASGPLGGIAISAARFYTSPMVFGFDPFFGYFAGPLYDTVFDPLSELCTYRAGSAFSLLAAAVALSHLKFEDTGKLIFIGRGRALLLVLGALAGAGSAAITAYGPELHHFSTTASIQKALGRKLSSRRCDLHYSSHLRPGDMQLLGRECDAHVRDVEAYFESRGFPRITVYVFASADEKRALMGAGTTQIAKPWRHEIYVQADVYPHPVLGHELAHVIASEFARGPFRVAGPLGGWLPDPGRIEGTAVAASPSEDSDLSLQGWARAMQDLGLLPPLSSIFRLSFLGENSSKAYTVAGAFVEWFKTHYGVRALRRWYGGSDLAELTGGKDLAALERDFRQSLRAVPIEPRALLAAKARFDRPAIFGRACPHAVDELDGEANGRLAENDPEAAREVFNRLLELDPKHAGARLALGVCALRQARFDEARRRYAEIAHDPALPRLVQSNAEEALGDVELVAGNIELADRQYQRVAEVALDADRERTLDVKRLARADLARDAIVNLLIGGVGFGPSWDVAGPKLGQWVEAEPDRGVAAYLLGKNFYLRHRWDEAARYLDRALSHELSPPSVEREAFRVRALVACAVGDAPRALRLYDAWRALPGLPAARIDAMRRFLHRCQ